MNPDKRERVLVTPELLGKIGESLKNDGPAAADNVQAMLDQADDGAPPPKAAANANGQAAADVKAGEAQAAQFKTGLTAMAEKAQAGRKSFPIRTAAEVRSPPTSAPSPAPTRPARACGDRPSIFRR